MQDDEKTKEQLIDELNKLRRKVEEVPDGETTPQPAQLEESTVQDQVGSLTGPKTVLSMTELEQGEAELPNLQRNLESLWELVRLQDEGLKVIADYVLEQITTMSMSQYGFYGFINNDETEMTIYSWSKAAMQECQIDEKPIVYPIAQAGVWGDAVRKRRIIAINNYNRDFEGKKGLPKGHMSLTRLLSIPIFSKGKIVVVGAVANKDSQYTMDDIRHLEAFLSNAQVIIERKRFENDLRRHQKHLEETVEERTAELKQAQQALLKSTKQYQAIFENASVGIDIVDERGFFQVVNPALLKTLGYTQEEMVRLTNLDITHPEDREISKRNLEGVLRGNINTYRIEKRFVRKDGTVMWGNLSVAGIRDSDGKCRQVVGVIGDITRRKEAEQERENLRAQLLQSQKMETMGTLAAGIAHDFNNMLAVILGYSSMLLADKNEKDPEYEGLQKIVKTSEDAADLVQRIRIFGRRAEMDLVPLDLNHQIDEVTKLLSHTLPKTIDIEIHLTKDPVIIKADSSQIAQMVMNLAVNAGEAMPQAGRLSILTENIVLDDDYCRLLMGVKPGPHVMLTVSDTGRGIDKGLMERIFDPFYSTKMRDYHKGTGLGLSVVQGIVQQHGGHITVESEVGQGTTFRMYFPALEVEKVPEYVEKEIPYPAGGNETILLVEDWEMVRELGVTILEKFGYTVLSAGDGQEALEVYEKEQGNISLVILDILMPRMDGKECLEGLLRINPAVKVIISSGVGHYDLINDIVKIGAKGAVNKPYSMRQLLGMVREVLDGD